MVESTPVSRFLLLVLLAGLAMAVSCALERQGTASVIEPEDAGEAEAAERAEEAGGPADAAVRILLD